MPTRRLLQDLDPLVELLISTVHAINARADRRVTEEMVASFKRVRNKNALLARISEASLNRPQTSQGFRSDHPRRRLQLTLQGIATCRTSVGHSMPPQSKQAWFVALVEYRPQALVKSFPANRRNKRRGATQPSPAKARGRGRLRPRARVVACGVNAWMPVGVWSTRVSARPDPVEPTYQDIDGDCFAGVIFAVK